MFCSSFYQSYCTRYNVEVGKQTEMQRVFKKFASQTNSFQVHATYICKFTQNAVNIFDVIVILPYVECAVRHSDT